MILTKESILSASDKKIEKLPVPEWGGEIFIKVMSGSERDRFEAWSIKQKGKSIVPDMDNIRSKLCVLTICDEAGERLFNDNDVIELGKKSGAALSRVMDAAQRINLISNEDIDELVGESESVQS